MRLSSLADYAIVMMSAAARHQATGGAGVRLNATRLADETRVPLPTAQKLVSRLAAAGLIESTRGTGGGFVLARRAAAISLADIIEAVEGRIALTTCVDTAAHDCALDHHCSVKPHWGVVNEAVRGALAGVSLADLSSAPVPLASSGSRTPGAVEHGPGALATPDCVGEGPLSLTVPTYVFPFPSPSREREGSKVE